ncbi:mRNA decapping enzyme [Carp edema virus]|nr:mRNA decapping enzyme [Carp edema virus]
MRVEKNIVLKNILSILKFKGQEAVKEFSFKSDKENTFNVIVPYLNEFSFLPKKTVQLLSFNVFLITSDKKLIVCERQRSFVYSFFAKDLKKIGVDSNAFIKTNFVNLMSNINTMEFDKLMESMTEESKKFVLDNYGNIKPNLNFKEFILPGGKFESKDNNFKSTILREIREECRFVNDNFTLFDNICCYTNIFDTVIKKYFHCFSFVMMIKKTSQEVLTNFKTNKEVKGLTFVDLNSHVYQKKKLTKLVSLVKVANELLGILWNVNSIDRTFVTHLLKKSKLKRSRSDGELKVNKRRRLTTSSLPDLSTVTSKFYPEIITKKYTDQIDPNTKYEFDWNFAEKLDYIKIPKVRLIDNID